MSNLLKLFFLCIVINYSADSQSAQFQVVKQTIKAGDVTLHYEFEDELSTTNQNAFTETIVAGFDYYHRLFGGYPRDLNGKQYSDITIRVRHGHHLSGEADPKLLMLTWSDKNVFGIHNWRTLLLHELFHLWNAESFRYQDGREQWFNEGFSEFYAFQAAARSGIISPHDALAIAAVPIGFYNSASMLGKLSLREAGKSSKSKIDNYFLVYHGGWVSAMLLDHDIRRNTDNQCSLDQGMRSIYQNYRRESKLYNSADIVAAIKHRCGLDYSEFFKLYIDGTQIMNVSSYFDLGKALWDYEFGAENMQAHKYLYPSLGIN